MQGLVIRNTGSWYDVRTDNGRTVPCKIKGNFRLRGIRSTSPIAIGDRVTIIENSDNTAFISEIADRKNYIIRRASNLSKQSHILAANIDLVLLFFTINHPETSSVFIDRFLASAEAYRIPVAILFNKADLLNNDEKRKISRTRLLLSQAIRVWEKAHCLTIWFQKPTLRQRSYRKPIMQECTPPHLVKCMTCPKEAAL